MSATILVSSSLGSTHNYPTHPHDGYLSFSLIRNYHEWPSSLELGKQQVKRNLKNTFIFLRI